MDKYRQIYKNKFFYIYFFTKVVDKRLQLCNNVAMMKINEMAKRLGVTVKPCNDGIIMEF